MLTVDRRVVGAPPPVVWPLAVAVEQWPGILSHYRSVARLRGAPGADGVVEMAAWRPFGPLRWPVWWRSEIRIAHDAREVRYRHVAGVTSGMDVVWRVLPAPNGTSEVTIVHQWTGPTWPLIGSFAANSVIGPIFVHRIAERTLAGIARTAEALR